MHPDILYGSTLWLVSLSLVIRGVLIFALVLVLIITRCLPDKYQKTVKFDYENSLFWEKIEEIKFFG